MDDIILKAFNETVFMTFYSTIFSVIFGFILAVILTISAEDGLRPNKVVYKILDVIINILRSFHWQRSSHCSINLCCSTFCSKNYRIIT